MMKFLLKSLLLTFLSARSSWCVSSGALTQSPDVSAMEGEAVNITCCWTLGFERKRVTWLKSQTNTNKTEMSSFINQSQVRISNATSNCSHLTFMNVTREDSGRYICRVIVEVPILKEVNGDGTVITVTAKDNTMDNTSGGPSHWEVVFIYVLRCLPILALIITFLCINKLITKAQLYTPGATGNKLTAAQRTEEEETDEREIEAE